MRRKIINLFMVSLVSLSFVGCSNTNSKGTQDNEEGNKEQVENTSIIYEEERIESLKELEGEELIDAYKGILSDEELEYFKNNGMEFNKHAEYYKQGINLKIDEEISGNEWKAEKKIVEQLNSCEQTIEESSMDFNNIIVNWTNDTGVDIQFLEIQHKNYDKDNNSEVAVQYEENISPGETRKIKILVGKNIERVEFVSSEIYHVPVVDSADTIFQGCIPGKWYKNVD